MPTGQLHQLQRELQSHLLGKHSEIAAAIVDSPPLLIAERLDIYRNGYRVRLIEALDEIYPILHSLLGDEVFSALGDSYVTAHPSIYRSIRWYGHELAEFMSKHEPYSQQPILAEVALLEWTLAEVFDAIDATPVQRAAFSSIDVAHWQDLRFELHPSLRRLQFHWNTTAVWQAMKREETPPDPVFTSDPVSWLLWRQNLQNYFRSMQADEAAALEASLIGKNFGEICTTLIEWLPEDQVPLRAAGLLGTWADSGMIIGIHHPDINP